MTGTLTIPETGARIEVTAHELARARREIDERCSELRAMGYAVHKVEPVGLPVQVVELVGDERMLVTLDPLRVLDRLGVRRS